LVVLGRYCLERHLGSGASGVVWLAEDRNLRRRVALKRTVPERAVQLRDEASILAQFDHPNLVRVYDAPLEAGTPVLVMEYVEGESLRELLKRERTLPAAQVVELGSEVLRGPPTPTRRGSSTGTSSPATCSSPQKAWRSSGTSAWGS